MSLFDPDNDDPAEDWDGGPSDEPEDDPAYTAFMWSAEAKINLSLEDDTPVPAWRAADEEAWTTDEP